MLFFQELTIKRDQLAVRYDLDRFIKEANIREKMKCMEHLEAIEAKLKRQNPTISEKLIEVLKEISTVTPESQISILEGLNIDEMLKITQAFNLTKCNKQKLTKQQGKIQALVARIQTNSLLCLPNLERFDMNQNLLKQESIDFLSEKIEELNTRKRKGVSSVTLRRASETLDQKIEDILKKNPEVHSLFLRDHLYYKSGSNLLEREYEKIRLYQHYSKSFAVSLQSEVTVEGRGCLDEELAKLERKEEDLTGRLKKYIDQKAKIVAMLGKAVELTI